MIIVLRTQFHQEKALVGAFSVIVQPVVEPMDRFAALIYNDESTVPMVTAVMWMLADSWTTITP